MSITEYFKETLDENNLRAHSFYNKKKHKMKFSSLSFSLKTSNSTESV